MENLFMSQTQIQLVIAVELFRLLKTFFIAFGVDVCTYRPILVGTAISTLVLSYET